MCMSRIWREYSVELSIDVFFREPSTTETVADAILSAIAQKCPTEVDAISSGSSAAK